MLKQIAIISLHYHLSLTSASTHSDDLQCKRIYLYNDYIPTPLQRFAFSLPVILSVYWIWDILHLCDLSKYMNRNPNNLSQWLIYIWPSSFTSSQDSWVYQIYCTIYWDFTRNQHLAMYLKVCGSNKIKKDICIWSYALNWHF